MARAAPWVFLVVVVCFAIYRFALARAGKYPAAKAFFQVGAAALFFMLLFPGSRGRFGNEPPDPVAEMMLDGTPRVRALAAEVAGYRQDGIKYGAVLVRALRDPDPEVRREAHASLVRLTGVDLGGPESAGAVKAWGERFR
jgi:HEAT repeat protein